MTLKTTKNQPRPYIFMEWFLIKTTNAGNPAFILI